MTDNFSASFGKSGVGALPKKDKIDPWWLAMLGIRSVRPGFIRPKSGSVCPDN